jgi:hypothetical protein
VTTPYPIPTYCKKTSTETFERAHTCWLNLSVNAELSVAKFCASSWDFSRVLCKENFSVVRSSMSWQPNQSSYEPMLKGPKSHNVHAKIANWSTLSSRQASSNSYLNDRYVRNFHKCTCPRFRFLIWLNIVCIVTRWDILFLSHHMGLCER